MSEKITKEQILNNVLAKYPATMGVFNQFNIDSCCGGAVPIEEACKRDGADTDKVIDALNKAAGLT